MVEEGRENIMKEQKPENEKDKNDKKTLEANCACILETRGEGKIKRETCVNTPAKTELLAREVEISPTKLSELINKEINNSIKELNNSIKDAVQTIVKQCSMEEKKPVLPCSKVPERRSHVRRFCVVEEHYKKSPDVYTNRQTTSHASRQYNDLSSHNNSCVYTKMHENNTILLPAKNKVNNENKSKKHTNKLANNVSTDNRKMTGNVNIYICSETNDNDQKKGKKKSTLQSDTNTSSVTITEQSNSRCASASSTSSCKLINSIQEKRKKLQMQQSPNFNHEKMDRSSDSSDDNAVYDNGTLRRICRDESNESSEKQVDVKISENVESKDTIASTRDGCCCKDTSSSSIVLRDDSPYSASRASWTTVYPLETRVNDAFLSNAICTNVEQRDYRENDDRSNICENDSEYNVCHAIDGSRWLPKSIYTDCATYGKISKECFADNCKYRNKRLQDTMLNRNNIRKRQMGYKTLQQFPASCQREHVTRKLSTCSCIAEEEEEEEEKKEEEEDRYTNVNKVEEKFPENVCNDAKCSEKISVCRTFSNELAENTTVCVTSFSVAGERFEETQTCNGTFRDPVECPRGTTVCGTTFGNSKELPKVTRVCKEFVTEEPPEDITVCRTMFGEPKGLPEEVTICETALPDSKEAPKETICKIPDSDFANQDDVKKVSLNDEKDKFTKENTNGSSLSNQKENAEKAVKPENKYHSVVLNNFTRQKALKNIEQDEQREIIPKDQSKIPTASLGSIKNSKSFAQSYNHPIHMSNTVTKEMPNTLVNQRRMTESQLSLDQSMRSNFQQPGKVSMNPTTQDLVSNENHFEEKMQKQLKQERQDSPQEIETMEEKSKESLLYRSLKKLIDIIRRKTQLKERIETEKIESMKTTADDINNVGKSEIVFETKDGIRDQEDVSKKIATMSSPFVRREITRKILRVARTKPTPLVAGLKVREEKMIDISRIGRTTPKLLRVIAAKRLHLPLAVIATDSKSQVPEVESVPAKIIANGYVDRKEIPEKEIIPPESIPAEVAEDMKAEDSIAPKMRVTEIETIVKDIPEDPADIPKDISDKDRISEHIVNETAKMYVPCLQKKKPETELKKFIPCKSSEPNGCSCLIAKCIKCNNTFEDCLFKDNVPEWKEDCCTHCLSSTAQCTCALQYLKMCSRNEKSKFRITSPSKITQPICAYCYRISEECKYRKTMICYEPEKCRRCATRSKCSRMIDKCRCKSSASYINCCGPDRCCCATFALIKCHKTKKGCNLKRATICLYCDNPQHKCTCWAPIGKCSYCRLPSDVCNCQDDDGRMQPNRDRERIAGRPDVNRTIRVTSWKPKREIRRYFRRNLEDLRLHSTEECRCYEKPKSQYPEELPYQRLNIFSDVMNELQQKMSEAVCCVQCWKNPCCCRSQINQNNEKEKERKDSCYVRCLEIEKSLRGKSHRSRSPRNKSPNNCRCNSTFENKRENIVEKSISTRHTCFVCKSSLCRCGKSRSSCKKPLAKCYYCKSLPCTCIIAR